MENNLNDIYKRLSEIGNFFGKYTLNDKDLIFIEKELDTIKEGLDKIEKENEKESSK